MKYMFSYICPDYHNLLCKNYSIQTPVNRCTFALMVIVIILLFAGFCFMPIFRKHNNVIGTIFGYLEAIEELPQKIDNKGRSKRYIRCKCVCGSIVDRLLGQLLSDKHKHNCGCKNKTHGQSHTTLWDTWCNMKRRCYDKTNKRYEYYGGSGTVVCDEWKNDFTAFYEWAIKNGWKKGLQLDKDIKGDGKLYSPETCCFATRRQNVNKRRNTVMVKLNGNTMALANACRVTGVNYKNAYYRIFRYGWSVEDALKKIIK
jgi:hypothetical protein